MLLNESKTLTALFDILGHRQGKTDQIIGSFSCHVEQGLGIEKIGIYNWLCWAIFFSGPFR